MTSLLEDKRLKANKDYSCDLSEFVLEYMEAGHEITNKEKLIVKKHQKNGFKIKKGEVYLYTKSVDNGVFYTHRAIPEMAEIYDKYKLWEN